MPRVPSGILYFMVWKYGLYAMFLALITQVFFQFGLLDTNQLMGILSISILSIIPISWIEVGDQRLLARWNIASDRPNCDRFGKAALYIYCCAVWPKYLK